MRLSLTAYFLGSFMSASAAQSASVGSVNTPLTALAAAVSGDTRYTLALSVPLRAKKLRLNVRSDTASVLGL